MEIRITTKHLLLLLQLLSWIIFIGLCVEAGGIIFNSIYTLAYNLETARDTWPGVDLSGLLAFDKGYYITVAVLMSIVAVMKALLFYLIVRLFHNKKLDLSQPFNNELKRLVSNIGYLALGIGFFSYWGVNYTKWLGDKGFSIPDIQRIGFGGADVWLFMGVILLVVALIFKRGIEIQSENDLTV